MPEANLRRGLVFISGNRASKHQEEMETPPKFCFWLVTWNCNFNLNLTTGQVGLGVGSWPSNRATEGSNPK